MAIKDPFDTPYPTTPDIDKYVSPKQSSGGSNSFLRDLQKAQNEALRSQQSGFTSLAKALADTRRAELEAKKQAEKEAEELRKSIEKDPTTALTMLNMPLWADVKPEGFPDLPYSQQKKMYDEFIKNCRTRLALI